MARALAHIIAHIRAVADNPNITTTLIQTEDLQALCDAAEIKSAAEITAVITRAIRDFSSPTRGRGDVHGGQRGYIVYENDGLPFIAAAVSRALGATQ